MNQSKIYITLALGSMLTFGSCSKDKLNPVTTTDLSDAVVYDTPQRIANQVNGLYGALKSGKMLGGRYLIYNDVRGRNFLNERGNAVTALTVWNFSIAGTDAAVNDLWSAGYSTINKVNIFLDGMSSKGNAVVGDELGKQYGGEAKYVRAVSYYTLLQLFCKPYTADNGSSLGLPLRLTPIIGNGFSDLARSSVAEIYTQILKDLDEAEAELPSSYGTAAANVTHAHKNTAIAMKVRVYQSMGQYDKVITEANKIVSASAPFTATSGVAFALVSDIKTVFSSYNTAESIFSSPFTGANEAPGGQNQLGYYYSPTTAPYSGNAEYSVNTSGIYADPFFGQNDARREFFLTSGNKTWLIKYPSPSPYTDWAPYLRYSDVLLSLAEALARTSGSVDARSVALLNAVHHRSDASVTLTTSSFASSTALIATILKEREIEFIGEGIYGTDISRLNETYPAKGSVDAVPISAKGYLFPSPQNEILYNNLWTE